MRIAKRILAGLVVAALFMGMPRLAQAQDDAQKTALEQKLKETYVLTKITDDHSDIVTAGSVLTLQKDGLMMCSTDAKISMPNTLKNDGFTTSFGDKMMWGMMAPKSGVNVHDIPTRKFVTGEKFFLEKYQVDKDGVEFEFVSDVYDNVRYWGQLKIPLPKNHFPPVDDAMKTIAAVIAMDSNGAAADSSQPVPSQPAPEPPQPAMAPIAPPPPPPDAAPAAPKTIALGETKDEVVAILGQPDKVANLGTKEIDYYPDMKVILIKGKVTDIQ